MPALLDLASLPIPASTKELFGRIGPLILEVGFGNGSFLLHLAKTHPEWNILGVDLARGSMARAWKRLQKAQVHNVQLHRGNALFVLRNIIAPGQLSHVYINFPDPWSKARHASRRLFQARFFPLLASRLTPGGVLHLTTDDPVYFVQSLDLARTSGLFDVSAARPPKAALDTKYARKWKVAARTVHHAIFRKIAEPENRFPPVIERRNTMHHALLDGTLPELSTFDSFVHPFDSGQVVLLDVMHMVGVDGLIFMARIQESDLVQEVLIQVRPARTGRADQLVSIMPFGQPLATRGTQEAAKAVTAWLVERGLPIVETYY